MPIQLQQQSWHWKQSFDGSYDGAFQQGNKTPNLAWNLAGLSLQNQNAGVSFNARSLLTGDGAAPATAAITLVAVSGDGITGWASADGSTWSNSTPGLSGSFLLRASYLGLTIDSDPITWSVLAVVGTAFIKHHPGDYKELNTLEGLNFTPDSDVTNLDPTCAGVVLRTYWGALEPVTQGVYDFSHLDHLLSLLRPQKKRLIVIVLDHGYSNNAPRSYMLPPYVRNIGGMDKGWSSRTADNSNQGWTVNAWQSPVMDRYIALMQALATHYNAEPFFEGISYDETSLIASGSPNGYSVGGLFIQLKRMMAAMRSAWTNTACFICNNFLGAAAQMEDFVAFLAQNKCGTGDPDVVPGNPGTGAQVYMGTLGGIDYRGVIPKLMRCETNELNFARFGYTAAQLVATAHTVHKATHCAWIDNGPQTGYLTYRTDILPVLRTTPNPNTACPSSYGGICSSA